MTNTEKNRRYWRKINREYAQNIYNLELFEINKNELFRINKNEKNIWGNYERHKINNPEKSIQKKA